MYAARGFAGLTVPREIRVGEQVGGDGRGAVPHPSGKPEVIRRVYEAHQPVQAPVAASIPFCNVLGEVTDGA